MDRKSHKPRVLPLSTVSFIVDGVLLAIAGYWFNCVRKAVPEPYLDEVFHVRQALAYWHNQWVTWDPKITTPPGLYVAGYAWLWVLQLFNNSLSLIEQLRSLNLVEGGFGLYSVVRQLLYQIPQTEASSESDARSKNPSQKRSLVIFDHAALNVCLFPPLFFFFSLFYTDVLSVYTVLRVYKCFHARRVAELFLWSLLALTLRQTNIFWTAVYLGGLEVVRNLPTGRPEVEYPCKSTFTDVISGSWHHGCLYDPLVSEAWSEDYLKTIISLAIAALANLQSLLQPLLPYLLLLFSFGVFVLWNGGVVLGDKDNHIASIHLTQMLYIWPYITFFSLPLLYPYILNTICPQYLIPLPLRAGSTWHLLPRISITIPILTAMLASVHYNTLVHPFTLADNRHYTFYVFRLLFRHPVIKYMVVPVYYICAWAAIVAIAGFPVDERHKTNPRGQDTGPVLAPAMNNDGIRRILPPRSLPLAPGNRVSFILVWLITTALSVITAPLVEPRYFIVPWLMWRLHVPVSRHGETGQTRIHDKPRSLLGIVNDVACVGYDHRLWLETVWFLIVNCVVGYIFLNWGFEWKQDPGLVQRFMW